MGSDLHMSPPTPPEYRIVRKGDETAVYYRNTDSIYGDTQTWNRKHHAKDPEGAVSQTLRALHPNWTVVSLPPAFSLAATLSYTVLATPDRDFNREIEEVQNAAIRAHHRAQAAHEEAFHLEQKAAKITAEWKAHMREQKRNEAGNAALGCLVLIGIFVGIFFLMSACFAIIGDDTGSDCYHTPGAQPGSAQAQRDLQNCIEGR